MEAMGFDNLAQAVIDTIMGPMLPFEDKLRLLSVSRNCHRLFQTSSQHAFLQKILHSIIYADFNALKFLIENIQLDRQVLGQKGTVTLAHTGKVYKGTALQIARRVKDDEMVAFLQSHMSYNDINSQQQALFPKGYEVYKKQTEAKMIKAGFEILEATFEDIAEAKVEMADDDFIMDEQAESALKRLREFLKNDKFWGAAVEDLTDVLLKRAFQLFIDNLDRFSTPNLKVESPKNTLVLRQVVGLIQRYLPLNYIQALHTGVVPAVQRKEKGQPQTRSLRFVIKNGRCYATLDILVQMNSSPTRGLGFDYVIGPSTMIANRRWQRIYRKLSCLKDSKLSELMHPVVKPKAARTCQIL